ncbi:MAG: DUF192 domain-containing protein [Candidatus Obscuribacterales bacterium]|nr:DUF192 domain-containing protein [Steroidobacteraceae bacterium]
MRNFFLLTLMLFCGATAAQTPVASMDSFPQDTLAIATPDARMHRFKIWIADNDTRRMQGLMFVKALPSDQGMLFIYPSARPIAMWMKNTFISLDMLFIKADGRVARVAASTKPHSLQTIEAGESVLAVLELPAGTAKRLNIARGALVMHAAFDKAKAAR